MSKEVRTLQSLLEKSWKLSFAVYRDTLRITLIKFDNAEPKLKHFATFREWGQFLDREAAKEHFKNQDQMKYKNTYHVCEDVQLRTNNPELKPFLPCTHVYFDTDESWKNATFNSWEEAEEYALRWLGDFAPEKGFLQPNQKYDYTGYNDYIVIWHKVEIIR